MSSLDDLFEQILISEEVARKRKHEMKEVKQQLQEQRRILSNLEEKAELLKGKHLIQRHQLIVEEFKQNVTTCNGKSLSDKVQCLEDSISQLKEQLTCQQQERKESQVAFCSSVREFHKNYGLRSNGSFRRQVAAGTELEGLTAEQLRLENELTALQTQHNDKNLADVERKCCLNDLGLLRHKLEVSGKELKEARKVTSKLEGERNRVNCIPKTDKEFKRLHAELEEGKRQNMESTQRYTLLQEELDALQQQEWQAQLSRTHTASRGVFKQGTQSQMQPSTNIHTAYNFASKRARYDTPSVGGNWNLTPDDMTELTEEDFEDITSRNKQAQRRN